MKVRGEDWYIKPMTNIEHTVEGCKEGMACRICMLRCYDGLPGHLFENGESQPCNCGRLLTIEEAKRKPPPDDV
jgi:hypothetical protein